MAVAPDQATPVHSRKPRIAAAVAIAALGLGGLVAFPASAQAATVPFGSVAGQSLPQCTAITLPRGDDNGSIDTGAGGLLTLPVPLAAYGLTFDEVEISTNGYVQLLSSTNDALYAYIAPFNFDANTTDPSGGTVTYGVGADGTFCAVWNNVGYFNGSASDFATGTDALNTFEVVLTPRYGASGTSNGDFDMTYNYDSVQYDQNGDDVEYRFGDDDTSVQNSWVLPGSNNEDGTLVDGGSSALVANSIASAQHGRYNFSFLTDGAADAPGTLIHQTPTVSGATTLGSTLTASTGGWGPGIVSTTLQWTRDGFAIPGATASTYTLTEADLLHSIAVTETGTKELYASATISSASVPIGPAAATIAKPKVSGNAVVGTKLKASVASVVPATAVVTYQWLRNGVAIAKATGSSYKVTSKDKGKKLSVLALANRAGYATAAATSASTAKVTIPFKASPKPKITGSAKVGKTLTAKVGSFKTTKVKLAYRWYANGTSIKKATHSTLKLTKSVKGKKITVTVTAKKSTYFTTVVTSKSTGKVKK